MIQQKFPIKKILYILLNKGSTDRVNMLLHHPKIINIIRSIPSINLGILIKDIGIHDTIDLFEIISLKQFKDIFDLDLWINNKINLISLNYWFTLLSSINENIAFKMFYNLDFSLILLLFKKFTQIIKIDSKYNYLANYYDHMITPDNKFIICFVHSNSVPNLSIFLKKYINFLYYCDIEYALSFIHSTQENDLYYLNNISILSKNNRLSKFGLLNKSTLNYLFKYKNPSSFFYFYKKKYFDYNLFILFDKNTIDKSIKKFELLYSIFSSMSSYNKYKYYSTLFYLTNQIIFFSYSHIPSSYLLEKILIFVLSHIHMSLSYISKTLKYNPFTIFFSIDMYSLFKIGNSLCLNLKIQWFSFFKQSNEKMYKYLHYPFKNVIIGIRKTQPQFYLGLINSSFTKYSYFKNLNELVLTSKLLSNSAIYINILLLHQTDIKNMYKKYKYKNMNLINIMCTYICLNILNEKNKIQPLNKNMLLRLSKIILNKKEFKLLTHQMILKYINLLKNISVNKNISLNSFIYSFVNTLISKIKTDITRFDKNIFILKYLFFSDN